MQYVRNGKAFNIHESHVIDGVQYGANWFQDEEARIALGIEPVYHIEPPAASKDKRLVLEGFERDVEERWIAQWAVVAKTAEELATEAAELASARAALLLLVDSQVDLVYDQTVGKRGPEYADALADAELYKSQDYTGDIPQSVADWAQISGLTAKGAADNVIATAAGLKAAQAALRKHRLTSKQMARTATSKAALDVAKGYWSMTLSAVRGQLGI